MHVLQANVRTRAQSLAYHEYSEAWPHLEHTLGYAGGKGPPFYISTIDNRRNHGPGSRRKRPEEADSCFARIAGAASKAVVARMQTQPGAAKPNGFVPSAANHIQIRALRLLAGTERDAAMLELEFTREGTEGS